MITLFSENFKQFSQDSYDREVRRAQIHRLRCSFCRHAGCLRIHGYYYRTVWTPSGPVRLRILRLICSCGKTHAVLLSSFVPYSRVSVCDHVKIISCASSGEAVARTESEIPLISEWSIRNIRRNFSRFWKERLRSAGTELLPMDSLVKSSFRDFFRQFMQIHRGPNILFS